MTTSQRISTILSIGAFTVLVAIAVGVPDEALWTFFAFGAVYGGLWIQHG